MIPPAVWWVAAVYVALGVVPAVFVTALHVRRLGNGWPLYFGGCLTVGVLAALTWPYMLVLVRRAVRRVRAEQQVG